MLCNYRNVPNGWMTYYKIDDGYRVHYSFYKACLSVLDGKQNEFWMIWSDVLGLLWFLYLFETNDIWNMGLYFGIISSKCCSLTYHIFNCVSLRLHQTLIYIDLLGIANMAFGAPYAFMHIYDDNVLFEMYCVILGISYLATLVIYLYLFYYAVPYDKNVLLSQTLIFVLGLIGNIPLLYAAKNSTYQLATLCFAFSYVLFYILKIPECLMNIQNMRLIHSHIFWHIGVSVTQYLYVRM